MIKNCRIRAFAPKDLPRLHAIREAAYKSVFQSFRDLVGETIAEFAIASAEREQAEYLDTICGADSSHDVFVIEHGTDIVAFCSVNSDPKSQVGEIDLNAVHPDHQGRGIGTWMFEEALNRLRAAGMRVATVGTGADASHAPARRAYEKAGFGPAIPSQHLYRML